MRAVALIIQRMRENPRGVRFSDLCKICEHFFGPARKTSGSHRVYRTPWPGDPRVNIQNYRGYAKTYQVKQVLRAIEKLENQNGT
jgi:hypothetical protein